MACCGNVCFRTLTPRGGMLYQYANQTVCYMSILTDRNRHWTKANYFGRLSSMAVQTIWQRGIHDLQNIILDWNELTRCFWKSWASKIPRIIPLFDNGIKTPRAGQSIQVRLFGTNEGISAQYWSTGSPDFIKTLPRIEEIKKSWKFRIV